MSWEVIVSAGIMVGLTACYCLGFRHGIRHGKRITQETIKRLREVSGGIYE